MPKKILFSPIGGTDPIKYERDGSMLHICRHYLPDVVYLYMSSEMLYYHEKDNRYVSSIEWLGNFLGHKFEVHLIERPELRNAHEYDVFYEDFREEIGKIEKGMEPGDELLLNMASGTPAMKSSLMVIATFAEYRFKAIQVSSPQKGMNEKYENRKDYDGEINCELNEDNDEGAENRCKEVQCVGLVRLRKLEIIKKHILAYDYAAALSVASELKDGLPDDAYTMIRIADARIKLNQREISRLNKNLKYNIYPVSEGNKMRIFEYALGLQVKIARQEYADFIRGVTPLVVDVLELILERKCGIKLESCCVKNNMARWDLGKLKNMGLLELLNQKYNGNFREGPVYSGHIAAIIEGRCEEMVLKQKISKMVELEGKVRNVAAHEMVSVTDEWFMEKTGKNARQIFDLIKYLVREAGVKAKEEDWNSYDVMNKKIEDYLDGRVRVG